MQLLLRLANIAREQDVSSKRAHQLVRGIEPAAMTPDGLRLYDPSVLETLTKRRRERALKMAKGTDHQRGDDPAGAGENKKSAEPFLGARRLRAQPVAVARHGGYGSDGSERIR